MQGFWNDNMTEGIGFVAAACTTFAFVPQLVKIRRQGGRDLSYFMLGIYLAGLVLWLVYGLRLRAPAIIAANIVAMVLVVAAIIMKAIMDRRISVTPSPQMERPMASSQVKDVIPETRSRSAEAAPGLN